MHKTTLSVLAATLLSSSLSSQWIRNPQNGSFYRATKRMSWTAAQAEAKRLGGNLATVRNQAENDWILKTFGSLAPNFFDGLWIGLSDAAKEGNMVWDGNGISSFRAWDSRQPDNWGNREDYVHMWTAFGAWNVAGRWNDIEVNPVSFGLTGLEHGFVGIVERRIAAGAKAIGKGCASSNPGPALSAPVLPRLGTTFRTRIDRLAPRTGGYFVVGASSSNWRGQKLPLDLRPIGMAGCQLLVSWDLTQSFFSLRGGSSDWALWIPLDVNLVGIDAFAQGFFLDPKANALGVGTTNGLHVTLGL